LLPLKNKIFVKEGGNWFRTIIRLDLSHGDAIALLEILNTNGVNLIVLLLKPKVKALDNVYAFVEVLETIAGSWNAVRVFYSITNTLENQLK